MKNLPKWLEYTFNTKYIKHPAWEAEGNITYHWDVLSTSLKHQWLRPDVLIFETIDIGTG